jgi:L-alanine-DL-glutamate epimerase-like enolase superfamily enzyme
MKLKLHPFDLALRHTFTTSHGSRNRQPSLVVELHDGTYSGYGEAAATSYYGVSVERMMASLENIRPLIEAKGSLKPEAFWERCAPELGEDRFALCALDMAMHDLYGKRRGLPLYKCWGLSIAQVPISNFTIGIDTAGNMLQKMQDFPWPLYKIKLGAKGGIEEDIEIVRKLRQHSTAPFRVDANGAWTAAETITASKLLKKLQVEFIEQPLPAAELEEMKTVYARAALPLIADESCIEEADVARCHQHFHGINIKLTKCGGLTPALRMIAQARKRGLKVMVGCMTESSVGISAIAQLLPLLDYVDMDGALLLKEDIAEGVKMVEGKIYFPERNGTGVRLL